MSSIIRRGLAATGLLAAVTTVVSVGAAPAQAAEWISERGIVVECQGRKPGLQIRTTVYENHRYGNTAQVVIGDPRDDIDGSRTTDRRFLVDGFLRATVHVDGDRAVIKGTASRYGARIGVQETLDDGGYLVQTRGFQRRLRTNLVAKYAGKVVPLTCATAFYYNLETKKTPIG